MIYDCFIQGSSCEIQVQIDDSFLYSTMYAFVLVEQSVSLLLLVRITILSNTEIVPTPSYGTDILLLT
jgi:hypothetical protein